MHTEGAIVFNAVDLMLDAAIEGFGVTYLPRVITQKHIDAGQLMSVLEDWCPSLPGYHLYYPSRRQPAPAFALLVDALRFRS